MKVLLVDGKNLSYRCFVAGDFTTRSGEHVEVPFLFTKILSKIVRDLSDIERVIVCWDNGVNPWRREFYPEYKKREAIPESLEIMANQVFLQYAKLKEVLNALGVYTLQYSDTEADDLIAYLRNFSAEDNYTIVSSDKDYLHLVTDRVSVFDGKDRWSRLDTFSETHKGLNPSGYLHAHALLGDGSDNISGISGVGWGTVAEIIEELNTAKSPQEVLNQIRQNYPNPKKRIKAILDNEIIFLRNHTLIDLRTPRLRQEILTDIEERFNHPIHFNTDAVIEFLRQHEMQSLLAKFNFWFSPFMRLI